MKNLPTKLQKQLDRINLGAKGIKLRARSQAKGGFKIFTDVHTNGKRKTTKTDFILSGLPEYSEVDNRTMMELSLLIRDKQRLIVENRYKKSTDANSDVIALRWFENYASQKGSNSTENMVTNHLKVFFQNTNNLDLLFSEVNYNICNLFSEFLKKLPLKHNTVHIYFSRFKFMLNEAVKQNIISSNPANKIKTNLEDTNPDYLTQEEIIKLIKAPTKFLELKNAVLFSCFSGLRSSDIKKLEFTMIKDNILSIVQTKTKSLVRIPINNNMRIILDDQKSRHNTNRVFHLKAPTTVNYQLKILLQNAGILTEGRKLTFHSTRHTAGLIMYDNDVPLQVISKVMGHKSLTTTMIYQNIKDKQINEAMQSIPDFFTGKN